jgi:hypothetical protein
MIYGAFLIFIGLVVLLVSIHNPIAIAAIAFLGTFMLEHCLTSIVPCFRPDAPYKTPMGNFVAAWFHGVRLGKRPSHALTMKIETEDVERQQERLDEDILRWLLRNAKTSAIRELAQKALSSRSTRTTGP